MNTYSATGLALAAYMNANHRILVVSYTDLDQQEAVRHLAELDVYDSHLRPTKVDRRNGAERVDYPNGSSIRFERLTRLTEAVATRIRPDVVYIDTDARESLRQSSRNLDPRLQNPLHDFLNVAQLLSPDLSTVYA